MKALSIKQPWASMIASGEKTIETRTWTTSFRGPLLIVSSKRPVIEGLPSGMGIAIVKLVDCRPMTVEDQKAACCDIYPGAIAWVFEGVLPVQPTPVVGQLGLYDYPPREVSNGS